MKFFVDTDGSLTAAADDCLNPNNLPIIEVELPAPIQYCRGKLQDGVMQLVVVEDWQRTEESEAVSQFKKQLTILVDQRVAELILAAGFKSRAEVLGFAANEGPLQEKAKTIVDSMNLYMNLAQEAVKGQISMQALFEFRDLLASE